MTTPRRVTLTLSAAAGGLLAAALLPVAVASADEELAWEPDFSTFDPTSGPQGFPPFYNEVMGTETWDDVVPSSGASSGAYVIGDDTETIIGSFTNNDLVVTSNSLSTPIGMQIDFANFGDGWANEWVDLPAGSSDAGVSDMLITPLGELILAGTYF
jgi:hypothetical protein